MWDLPGGILEETLSIKQQCTVFFYMPMNPIGIVTVGCIAEYTTTFVFQYQWLASPSVPPSTQNWTRFMFCQALAKTKINEKRMSAIPSGSMTLLATPGRFPLLGALCHILTLSPHRTSKFPLSLFSGNSVLHTISFGLLFYFLNCLRPATLILICALTKYHFLQGWTNYEFIS